MYQYLVQVKDKDSDPWQILHGWARPFTYGFTLDDTLDSGKIVLPFSTAEPIVKPFSRVRITINEDGAQVDCIDAPRLPPFHGRRDFPRDDAPPSRRVASAGSGLRKVCAPREQTEGRIVERA